MSWAPVNESKVGTDRQNLAGTGNMAENQQISFTKEEPGTTGGVFSCLQRADGKPAVRHQRDLTAEEGEEHVFRHFLWYKVN